MTTTISTRAFNRTRFTWFAYSLMFIFAVGVALPGPVVPFIGERLGLSYTQRGLHFTALAAGNLLIGLVGDRLADRLGNRATAWLFVVLTASGGAVMIFGPALSVTLPAVLVMGVGAGGCALLATATLADAHPDYQARALTESNISAGLGVATTPLLVGLLEAVGIGWQGVAVALVLLAGGLGVVFGGVAFPPPRSQSEAAKASGSGERPLPPRYWIFGVVVFMTVAIEWVIISWTPDFLNVVRGFDRGTAAALGSGFAWAIVLGRVLGRWLLEVIPAARVLVGAYILLIVLFPVYAYSPSTVISLGALFVLGLVLANQFPLVLAAAMEAGEEQTNRASARISVFGGLATLTLPQVVGSVADVVGIQAAYGIVIGLGVVAVGLSVFAIRR